MHTHHLNAPGCTPKSAPLLSKSSVLVLFDGECPLCRASTAALKKLDWLGWLDFRSFRDPKNIPDLVPPLRIEAMDAEMHAVFGGGHTVRKGFAAFRGLAWRLPPLAPIAPLLYLPGVGWIGQKVYLWVARNRLKLVPCKDGVCALPGARVPSSD